MNSKDINFRDLEAWISEDSLCKPLVVPSRNLMVKAKKMSGLSSAKLGFWKFLCIGIPVRKFRTFSANVFRHYRPYLYNLQFSCLRSSWKSKQFSLKPQKDSFISGLLMSAPAAILSILLVFSSPYFHATLITCSLRYSTVLIMYYRN